MLDRLVASAPAKSWSLGGTLFSTVFHAALVFGALRATMGNGGDGLNVTMDTMLVFIQPEEQKPETPPEVQLADLPTGFVALIAPVSIPTDIPPVNLKEVFDPRDYTGVGKERAGGELLQGGGEPAPGEAYIEAMVDEKPEIIASPPLKYPDILRQAGLQGSVLVEAIIDTAGHAEPGSIRVISSTNTAFEISAKDVVLKSIYRPGRVAGQVVRVLVNVPVDFSIRKSTR
jgi:protein TonB